jgi:hypothetical protein
MSTRNRSKMATKRGSRRSTGAPRTIKQYFEKPARFQNLWDRVVSVVSKMRSDGASLQRVSREFGISPETVRRWAGSALRKQANGRYKAKPSDSLLRILKIPSSSGTRDIGVRGSRQATLIAEYWNAVHRYLETGDASRLQKFRGKFIKDADGVLVPLLTDLAELNRLGNAGVLSFESLYSRVS